MECSAALALNDIQVTGTHNSYKQAMGRALDDLLLAVFGEVIATLAYAHAPLHDPEATRCGVRQRCPRRQHG
ncbi:MAG: hypothetical protein EA417_17215 [Gammaproteobacteria bacterium]|nr:MAG: hypothetical protein EA417_17215 [Gammaproteobacteria bacterium]